MPCKWQPCWVIHGLMARTLCVFNDFIMNNFQSRIVGICNVDLGMQREVCMFSFNVTKQWHQQKPVINKGVDSPWGCLTSDAESCFSELCLPQKEACAKHSCALHIYHIKIKLKYSIITKIKQRCKLSESQIKRFPMLWLCKQDKMTPWGSLLILKLLDIRTRFQERCGSECTHLPSTGKPTRLQDLKSVSSADHDKIWVFLINVYIYIYTLGSHLMLLLWEWIWVNLWLSMTFNF